MTVPFTNTVDREQPRHTRHHVWLLAGEVFPEGEEVEALCGGVHVTSGEDLVHVSVIGTREATEETDLNEWLKHEDVCTTCADLARERMGLPQRPLTEISGVGQHKAEALRRGGFTSIPEIRRVEQQDLAALPEIGNALAARIKADVGQQEEVNR